ncbi:hypothetical protein EDC96DRAFT_600752 [Choanephora cucurbitarum]|nr:hypothetical protein EDC96DRAFT_600752 [Choanephora cucurbitarum]
MTNTKDSNAVSPSFRSLLSVSPVYELSMCFQRQDESKIECKVQDMLSFIKGKYPTMRQFYNARKLKDQKEKQKETNRTQDALTLISEESIPEFLFIVDSTNFDPKFVDHKSELKEYDCQAYFPDTFSINVPAVQRPQKPKYTLHVRVYSTHTSGVHYLQLAKYNHLKTRQHFTKQTISATHRSV